VNTRKMASPIDFVVAEALSRGFRVERLPTESKRHAFDKRLLLVEGKRCQVIPSRRGHPNALYPRAEYFPLYLPRNNWPDFLIYVSLHETPTIFRIISRAEMSKDTGWSPESLEPYRDAWELLQQGVHNSAEKKFEILSWQLQAVKTAVQNADLEVEFIKTKKHKDGRNWPPVVKRRVLVAGKKCAIFSATRISQDPEKLRYNYAIFKISHEKWHEFLLYLTRNVDDTCDVFVVPRKHITATTSAALDHPELVRYKNAWGLLTASDETLAVIPPVKWKEPTIPPPPTRHSLILQEVVCKAESLGLAAESTQGEVTSHKGVQSFLYISKKRCQVMEANVAISNSGFRYISLNPPTSEWPDYLIFRSSQSDDSDKPTFYVLPRQMLLRQTSRSVVSKWLKDYEEAWHLLR
jgi:hypothetical protein